MTAEQDTKSSAARGCLLLIASFLVAVGLLISVVFTSTSSSAAQCAAGRAGTSGVPVGVSSGALGGIAGTGITESEYRTVKARGGGRTTFPTGQYEATSYGPPWTGINGPGIATSAGIRIHGGAPRKYWIAVDHRVIPYGSWVYAWPNPHGWRGPFLAADTGDLSTSHHMAGRRIDFYDWRGRTAHSSWGRRPIQVSSRPIAGDASEAVTQPAAETTSTGSGRVLVVGDSLGVGLKLVDLANKLGAGATIDAKGGRTSTQGLARIRELAGRGSTWVVVLGTNDTDPAVLRRNVRSIKALAAERGAALRWVTIARKALHGSTEAQLNAVLRAELAADQLIDWHSAVRGGRASLGDGIHPAPSGYRVLAGMVTDSVSNAAAGGEAAAIAAACQQAGAAAGGEIADLSIATPKLPADPQERLRAVIAAMHRLERAKVPYCYGGGHGLTPAKPSGGQYCWGGNPLRKVYGGDSVGLDCSSSVSWVLQTVGYRLTTMTSGSFASWGEPGRGRWLTLHTNATHIYLELKIEGRSYFWGTSTSNYRHGPGWHPPRDPAAFVQRHPPGL